MMAIIMDIFLLLQNKKTLKPRITLYFIPLKFTGNPNSISASIIFNNTTYS